MTWNPINWFRLFIAGLLTLGGAYVAHLWHTAKRQREGLKRASAREAALTQDLNRADTVLGVKTDVANADRAELERLGAPWVRHETTGRKD